MVPDYKVKFYVRVKRNTDKCSFQKVFDEASIPYRFEEMKCDSFKMISRQYLAHNVEIRARITFITHIIYIYEVFENKI